MSHPIPIQAEEQIVHASDQPAKKSASFDHGWRGDDKPLQFVRRGSLDPADLYAPMYQSVNDSAAAKSLLHQAEEKSKVHIEGEMERTLHKTEKHHPDLIFNANSSDVGGQEDI